MDLSALFWDEVLPVMTQALAWVVVLLAITLAWVTMRQRRRRNSRPPESRATAVGDERATPQAPSRSARSAADPAADQLVLVQRSTSRWGASILAVSSKGDFKLESGPVTLNVDSSSDPMLQDDEILHAEG